MPPGTPKRSPSGQTNHRAPVAIVAAVSPRRKRCRAWASHWTCRSPPGVATVIVRSPTRAIAALSVCGSTPPGRGLAACRSDLVDSAVPTRLPNAMPVSRATQPDPNCVPARLTTTAADPPSPSAATLTRPCRPEPTTQRSTRRRSVSGATRSAKAVEPDPVRRRHGDEMRPRPPPGWATGVRRPPCRRGRPVRQARRRAPARPGRRSGATRRPPVPRRRCALGQLALGRRRRAASGDGGQRLRPVVTAHGVTLRRRRPGLPTIAAVASPCPRRSTSPKVRPPSTGHPWPSAAASAFRKRRGQGRLACTSPRRLCTPQRARHDGRPGPATSAPRSDRAGAARATSRRTDRHASSTAGTSTRSPPGPHRGHSPPIV